MTWAMQRKKKSSAVFFFGGWGGLQMFKYIYREKIFIHKMKLEQLRSQRSFEEI